MLLGNEISLQRVIPMLYHTIKLKYPSAVAGMSKVAQKRPKLNTSAAYR